MQGCRDGGNVEFTIEDVSGTGFQMRSVDCHLVTGCMVFLLLLMGHGNACGRDSDHQLTPVHLRLIPEYIAIIGIQNLYPSQGRAATNLAISS